MPISEEEGAEIFAQEIERHRAEVLITRGQEALDYFDAALTGILPEKAIAA